MRRFPVTKSAVNLSDPFDLAMNESINVEGEELTVHSVNTGVPHAVVIVDNIAISDIDAKGAAIRNHEHFAPAGTNVNFQRAPGTDSIIVRTYERGVEGETLACGTGVAANAIVHHELTGAPSPISVLVQSGDTLRVSFDNGDDGSYTNVKLTGPAEFVFEGEIDEEFQ